MAKPGNDKPDKATVQWQGVRFPATPIEQLPNGDWIMSSEAHTARTSVGTRIRVTPAEIIEMTTTVVAAPAAQWQAQLQAAMDEERKTLPSVNELLAVPLPK